MIFMDSLELYCIGARFFGSLYSSSSHSRNSGVK